jgi:hypothetical protein
VEKAVVGGGTVTVFNVRAVGSLEVGVEVEVEVEVTILNQRVVLKADLITYLWAGFGSKCWVSLSCNRKFGPVESDLQVWSTIDRCYKSRSSKCIGLGWHVVNPRRFKIYVRNIGLR